MSNSTQRALTPGQLVKLRAKVDAARVDGTYITEPTTRLEARFMVSIATLGRAALGLPVKEASARLIEAALERGE